MSKTNQMVSTKWGWPGVLVIVGICLSAQASLAMMAGPLYSVQTNPNGPFTGAVQVSTALLNGGGREFVYVPEYDGFKISDLRWEAANVWLAGVTASGQYSDWITVNAGYWTKLTASLGTHTDDDWNAAAGFEGPEPHMQTHYSEGDSIVEKAAIFDINASLRVATLSQFGVSFRTFLGYKTQTWKWKEEDSYGIYFEELYDGYYNETGDPVGIGTGVIWRSSETGITYEQQMKLPYLGIGAAYLHTPVSVEAYALYSSWGNIDAIDHHLARNLRTDDSFTGAVYWMLGLTARWQIAPRVTLVGSVETEELPNVTGDSDWVFYDSPEDNQTVEDGAGAGFSATTFAFSVVYAF